MVCRLRHTVGGSQRVTTTESELESITDSRYNCTVTLPER